MRIAALILFSILFFSIESSSQNAGINTTTPDNSAVLDIESTSSGLLIPRMTTAERNTIDLSGNPQSVIIFNTDDLCFQTYVSSQWNNIWCFDCAPTITSDPSDITICSGNNGIFMITATGQSLTYQWQVDEGMGWTDITVAGSNPSYAGFNSSTLSVSTAPVSANGYQYRCVVSGSCSPPATSLAASLNVNQPSVTVNGTSPVCDGDDIFLTASPAGGTYNWSGPNGFSSTQQNPVVTNITSVNAGSYSVTFTDAFGCTATGSTVVTYGSSSSGSQTFSYTGTQQTFVVPACVTSIDADVIGAGGETGGLPHDYTPGDGGDGARVRTTLSVTPGETLYLYVGGTGSNGNGGYNGGGNGGICGGTNEYGGGGGGASDIRRGGTALADRVVVAGGGGGGGAAGQDDGGGTTCNGADGGDGGQNGINGQNAQGQAVGGGGGTVAAGGAGGATGIPGTAGALGNGGTGGGCGAPSYYGDGGGGGGGYYGGGGGSSADAQLADSNDPGGGGGGGGSSYSAGTGTTYTTGYNSGNGQVVISW